MEAVIVEDGADLFGLVVDDGLGLLLDCLLAAKIASRGGQLLRLGLLYDGLIDGLVLRWLDAADVIFNLT